MSDQKLNDETKIEETSFQTENVSFEPKRKITFKTLNQKQRAFLKNASLGLGGVSMGAAAMLLMGMKAEENLTLEEEVTTDEYVENEVECLDDEVLQDVEVEISGEFSTVVDDSMSFSEAFAAARKDVGAGGLFVWKGEPYNTFRKEEWESLTEDEQSEFLASIDDQFKSDSVTKEEDMLAVLNESGPEISQEQLVNQDDDIVTDDIELFETDDIVILEDHDIFAESPIADGEIYHIDDNPAEDFEDQEIIAEEDMSDDNLLDEISSDDHDMPLGD